MPTDSPKSPQNSESPAAMRRRKVQFSDAQWRRVSVQAAREGIGKSDLVRKATLRYLARVEEDL